MSQALNWYNNANFAPYQGPLIPFEQVSFSKIWHVLAFLDLSVWNPQLLLKSGYVTMGYVVPGGFARFGGAGLGKEWYTHKKRCNTNKFPQTY